MAVVLLLADDSRLLPISEGIFGFLGIMGAFIMILLRREIWLGLKTFGTKSKLRLRRRK